MNDYQKFDRLVTDLYRPAIDAYMWSRGFLVISDTYISRFPGVITKEVSRPGENGQGGGACTTSINGVAAPSEDDAFTEEFQTVRSKIDELVERWRGLPDPDVIGDVLAQCRSVADILAPATSFQGGHAEGAGDVQRGIFGVMVCAESLKGQAIYAFKEYFLEKILGVGQGLYSIAGIRGGHVLAQQGLWLEARSNVVSILTNARYAFEQASQGASWTWPKLLMTAGWAVKGVTIFLGPHGKAVGEAAALALEAAAALGGETESTEEAEVGSYDDVVGALAETLNGLHKHIKTEEYDIEQNVKQLMLELHSRRDLFDASVPGITSGGGGSAGLITIDEQMVGSILNDHMPAISVALCDAAGIAQHFPIDTAVTRNWAVGTCKIGPSSSRMELSEILQNSLTDLAVEVAYGRSALERAVGEISATEEAAAQRLVRIIETMEVKEESEGLNRDSAWGVAFNGLPEGWRDSMDGRAAYSDMMKDYEATNE
jgi:hypothetical protein